MGPEWKGCLLYGDQLKLRASYAPNWVTAAAIEADREVDIARICAEAACVAATAASRTPEVAVATLTDRDNAEDAGEGQG